MTTNTLTTRGFSKTLREQLDGFFASFGQGFNAYIEARSRRDELEALEAMTDAELAKRGIKRDRIVQHVFRDRMFF